MAHYAILDSNNIVVKVIVGKDENDNNTNWEDFYAQEFGMTCKRTSYNTCAGIHYDPDTRLPSNNQSKAYRKNYAGIGYQYDEQRDAFIPPKPYPSWILNENRCVYEAPIPVPDNTNPYRWDEETLSWIARQTEISNGN